MSKETTMKGKLQDDADIRCLLRQLNVVWSCTQQLGGKTMGFPCPLLTVQLVALGVTRILARGSQEIWPA